MVQSIDADQSQAEWRRRVVAEFDTQVRQVLHDTADVSTLPVPQVAARNAARHMATRNDFDQNAGPFYDTVKVRQILGVSRQAIADRARHHTILRMDTTDKVTVFPTFQFVGGQVDPRLIPVLQTLLGSGASGWTVTLWLTTPVAVLEHMTPVEALRSGRADMAALVDDLAADDAGRWAA